MICRSWKSSGKCRFGANCKFKHEGAGPGHKRATILAVKVKRNIEKKARAKERKTIKRKLTKLKEEDSAKKQKEGARDSSDEDHSWLSSFLLTKVIPRTPRKSPFLDVTSLSSNHMHDPGLIANDTASAGTISTNFNDFPLG